ncbi:MAG: type II secretion system protein [Planctomycetota bacterium]
MSTSSSRSSRRGLSTGDVLVVVAIIGLLLGLATSLARQVREQGRLNLVLNVFRDLEAARNAYATQHGNSPSIPALLPTGTEQLTEEALTPELLLKRAQLNNVAMHEALASRLEHAGALRLLPPVRHDGERLLDPWGMPIVYDAGGTGLLGTARGDRPFFLSAGPDRDYRTRGDNVYSYEDLGNVRPDGSVGNLTTVDMP